MDKKAFFDLADSFYQQNVAQGLVQYSAIKKDQAILRKLTGYIARADMSNYSDTEKLAFYINAYNLTVIQNIVNHYPVKSPMDIKGFFDEHKNLIAGEQITLNELENKKLRSIHDPRIHFVLVCAALGCPKLAGFAYRPEKLPSQLQHQTSAAMNDPDFIRVSEQEIKISQIFKWYRQDFGNKDAAIISLINKHRNAPLPSGATLIYYPYNWNLNEWK